MGEKQGSCSQAIICFYSRPGLLLIVDGNSTVLNKAALYDSLRVWWSFSKCNNNTNVLISLEWPKSGLSI